MEDPSFQEFLAYKQAILEEAKSFLENKKEFLQSSALSLDYKILRVTELINFFEIEDEPGVVSELASIADALQIRRILDSKWLYPE